MSDDDSARQDRIQSAYCQLAAAIVLQAARDASSAHRDISEPARWWLDGEGQAFCLLLGLNLNVIRVWLDMGCPALPLDLDLTPRSHRRSSNPHSRGPA